MADKNTAQKTINSLNKGTKNHCQEKEKLEMHSSLEESIHLLTEMEQIQALCVTTCHYSGGSQCKVLSVPWPVAALRQLFRLSCSFVCGNHGCVPMIFVICFSWLDKEQSFLLLSQPGDDHFLFQPQNYQMSNPIPVTNLNIEKPVQIKSS